ncbi:MAG: hypothetical protein ACOYXO_12520, partial [Chloroflexota bacterium]
LDKMLGLPPNISDHRKPQNMLYLYETNQINEEKLLKFCEIVGECFPKLASKPNNDQTNTEQIR